VPAEPEPAASPPKRAKLNAAGEERPAFLLDFPEDPELEQLILAFEAGNFAQVRTQAPQLAASTADDAVRRAALELRRRIDPDPLLVALLGLCIVLFVFLVSWVYTR
jgi:hypothetical protein